MTKAPELLPCPHCGGSGHKGDVSEPALERVKQEARNEALREALAIAEERTPSKHGGALASHVTGCAIQAGISKLITEDQSDGED